jgi:transcriptional regulator with XRE-family HTH domain
VVSVKPHRIIAQLAEHRRAARINQEVLARRLHVHQVTVSGWETGRHEPTLAELASYAEAVGLRLVLVPASNPAVHKQEAA